jgi:Flp pilus assembly pilin Flp
MALMRSRNFARKFRRDEEGSAAVELMLVLPMLIWALLAVFVFFDAYRTQTTNLKAAYTLGDVLSRETGYITPVYMNSMFELQQFLLGTDQGVRLRVTVFQYDGPNDRYVVRWSQGRGAAVSPLTTAGLQNIRQFLPNMPNSEVAILTETRVGYVPPAMVGIQPINFDDRVVTRPRFAGQLCWNDIENGNNTTAVC